VAGELEEIDRKKERDRKEETEMVEESGQGL
jgi:hypothetical protein